MSFRIEVYDDGQWVVKAEGEGARALTDALGAKLIDLRAVLEAKGEKEVAAVLDQGGEIITIMSSLEEAFLKIGEREGQRVVLARVILPPPVP